MTYLNSSIKKNCTGCSACKYICPVDAIEMIADDEGFLYPKINKEKCTKCNKCIEVCHYNLAFVNDTYIQQVYAMKTKDELVKNNSSSGGMFYYLAQSILNNGGIVFGANAITEKKVVHKSICKVEDISDLMGSKYVESDVNDSYLNVKKYLDNNRSVLFVGTPCQIGGLKKYIGDSRILYTVDLVCGGVASPKVLEKYCEYLENKYNSKIISYQHRYKDYGWKNTMGKGSKITFSNGYKYMKEGKNDPYISSFSRNLIKRPSCYSCKYANKVRGSDITLGDYWGVHQFHQKFADMQGTSLVIVNSEKGRELLKYTNGLFDSIELQDSNIRYAEKGNRCLSEPVPINEDRQWFFKEFNEKSFSYVLKKYMKNSSKLLKILRRPKVQIKRYLRKVCKK